MFENDLKRAQFSPARTVALVANGHICDFSLIADMIKSYEQVVAVDGGLNYCYKMGIRPDFLIGDFDSVSKESLEAYGDVLQQRHPRNKDETDLELALKVIDSPSNEKIGIFGWSGKRTDHTLYNLYLMRCAPAKIILENEYESVFLLRGSSQINCFPGQHFSLIPFGASTRGVTSHGCQWELTNATLDRNYMSISNVCLTPPVHINIEEGELICVLARMGERE